ncbi:unnamed protein product [Rotaria socialis]|uniref:MULE transposase domain-containing protein n=2 Tax=Rotaria socialis TaxID=392032 RepID=A0A817SNR4_9BILA|nr:unnamed protein product [Rotaria socialis]CAF4625260.1 unnamed protein product [Rotaria socialis]
MYTIVETAKGKQCSLFDEYRYVCDRIQPPVLTSPYNHDPPKEANDIAQFKKDLKHRIREEQTPLTQLYRSELIKRYISNPENVATLLLFHQLKNILYRTKNEHYPPLPRSINEVYVEGKWRMSLDNEDFIIIDHHNPRYLAFGTLHSLKVLCESSHIFLDGTFKSCPPPFAQLYSIHCYSSILNELLLLNMIWFLIHNSSLSISNKVLLADLKNVFPNTTIKGCNFHYNQCIFKKIQDLALQKDYYDSLEDDPTSVKCLVQQTGALAFMPISKINELWCTIMDKFEHIPRSQDFFDYYTDTWIDKGCLYPRQLWNYYNFNGPRTNNGLEGWHHRLNSNIATSTPNIYVVIDELKKDYAFNMTTTKQLENNTKKPQRRKQFMIRNERILNLMNRYETGSLSLDDYFIKISKTIGKKK